MKPVGKLKRCVKLGFKSVNMLVQHLPSLAKHETQTDSDKKNAEREREEVVGAFG